MKRRPATPQPAWNFELDRDEEEHLSRIGDEALMKRLGLINAGARIAAALATEACQRPQASSRLALLGLLVIRAADQLRVTGMSLTLGHYQCVPLLLRAAVDAVSTLSYASSSPKRLKVWALLSCVYPARDAGLDAAALEQLRVRFHQEARAAYDALLARGADKSRPGRDKVAALQAMRAFNDDAPPIVEDLYELFGVSPGVKDLFGEKAQRALQGPRKDLEKALASLELRQVFTQEIPREMLPEGPREEDVLVGESILFNEDMLDHYAQVAHVATHHLFSLAEHLFGKGADPALVKAGKNWTEQSLALLPISEQAGSP